MEPIAASDLKTILHSKRANLYYLEHCRVLVNGGRVEYVTDSGKRSLYWNIPIANTTSILLGTGTSITQAAMRELAKAGVAAKALQLQRLNWLSHQWATRPLREAGFDVSEKTLQPLIQQFTTQIHHSPDVTTLLTQEAQLTKTLYRIAVQTSGYGEFTAA